MRPEERPGRLGTRLRHGAGDEPDGPGDGGEVPAEVTDAACEAAEVERLVLLGLRLVGFGDPEAVAQVVRRDPGRLQSALRDARERGLAQFRDGATTGWSLTPRGRAVGEVHLAAELDARGAREIVHRGYESFRPLNAELLVVCTDWQLRDPGTINDHTDPAYDRSVVARLAALHERIAPLCADLGRALRRFDAYRDRLDHALARVRAGEQEWFTGVRIPSYHSVWFELHENLLATLGIDRGAEPGEPRPGPGPSGPAPSERPPPGAYPAERPRRAPGRPLRRPLR